MGRHRLVQSGSNHRHGLFNISVYRRRAGSPRGLDGPGRRTTGSDARPRRRLLETPAAKLYEACSASSNGLVAPNTYAVYLCTLVLPNRKPPIDLLPLSNDLLDRLRKDRAPLCHILLGNVKRRNKPNHLKHARRQDQHTPFNAPLRDPPRQIWVVVRGKMVDKAKHPPQPAMSQCRCSHAPSCLGLLVALALPLLWTLISTILYKF